MMTNWLQISLNAHENDIDIYSDYLLNLGAVSITLEDAENDPIFEPMPKTTPLWQKTRLIGLFNGNANVDQIRKFLKTHLHQQDVNTLQIKPLEEKNWTNMWMDQFHPLQFGEKLWICPSFRERPEPSAVNIILDPGMAFGTGTHPTTALCLEWLDKHPPYQAKVIDYGCGSGILSLAALKLGATFVYAIDHDPQALESTTLNAKRNGFDETHLIPLLPEQCTLSQKIDLVLANILADPLLELAPIFANMIREEGMIVLSGILEKQTQKIIQRYEPWFSIKEMSQKEEWVRISAIRIKNGTLP